MPTEDDIHYALEATRVLREPDRRIDTFGDTRFEFRLISELMDHAGQVRVRSGEVEAHRPRIVRPEGLREFELDGFGPAAAQRLGRLIERLRAGGYNLAMLQYGFHFRRGEVREEVVHEPVEAVRDKLLEEIRRTGNPAMAIIEGVDDTWEISLLKFSLDMIIQSHEINAFDLKRRGLL